MSDHDPTNSHAPRHWSLLDGALMGLEVLVVDDDPDVRDLASEFLLGCGAHARGAASAEEAFRMLRDLRPDVVVSDIGMPVEDGLTLMRRIRMLPPEQGGDIPAVAVTGFTSREDARRVLAAGFQEYLTKPLELQRLADTLTRLTRPGARATERHRGRSES